MRSLLTFLLSVLITFGAAARFDQEAAKTEISGSASFTSVGFSSLSFSKQELVNLNQFLIENTVEDDEDHKKIPLPFHLDFGSSRLHQDIAAYTASDSHYLNDCHLPTSKLYLLFEVFII